MAEEKAHIKPVIGTTPASLGSDEVIFDLKAFEDLITSKGSKCSIERAIKCPCRIEGAGSPLSNCSNCGGTGWFFIAKINTRIVAQALSNLSKLSSWTESNAGTVSLTASVNDRLALMDRVTFLELEAIFTETKKLYTSYSKPYFCMCKYRLASVVSLT